MEIKPMLRDYCLTVEIKEDLEFKVEHLDLETAKKLDKVFADKFGRGNVYPEVTECYQKTKTESTAF